VRPIGPGRLKPGPGRAEPEGVMRDSGSIVIGWLTRLAATVAVFGLLAYDGIALATADFSASDHANAAASLAADTYKTTHDAQAAYNAAVASVAKDNETIEAKTFTVRPTDGHVTLTLHREAVTLWMHYIGPLKKYVAISSRGEGSPPQ
jgi:hypothetical protein